MTTPSWPNAASHGHFAVDPDHAKRMLTVIAECRDELDELSQHIEHLKVRVPLGDLPPARDTADLDVLVATGDPQSFDHAFDRFYTTLGRLEQAIGRAVAGYARADEGAAAMFASGAET